MTTAAVPRARTAPGGKHAVPATGYATAADADNARTQRATIDLVSRKLPAFLVLVGGMCLAFTATNVTFFATGHNVSPWIAWMLDPLVSITLVFCLWVEGKLSEVGIKSGFWPGLLRWFAGIATWLMNCWSSLYPDGVFCWWPAHPDPAGLVLHSVPPVLLIALAEASAMWRTRNIDKVRELQAVIDSHEAGLRAEEQRRIAEAEAEAECQRQHAEAEAERQRAEKDAERAREQAEAEARRAEERAEREAAREAEARREAARIEEERRNAAAERELKRQQFEAQQRREDQAEQRRIAEETERRRAEAEAARQAEEEARRRQAEEAEARRVEEERQQAEAAAVEERQRREAAAEQRRARKEAARKASDAPATLQETHPADGEVIMTREQREEQREEAIAYAARALAGSNKVVARELGERYGNSETWGRNQIKEARKRLDTDQKYRDRIETQVLEEMVSVEA